MESLPQEGFKSADKFKATEDAVNFLERIGVKTGVDLLKTVTIAREMGSYGLNVMSHLASSSVGREKEGNCQ